MSAKQESFVNVYFSDAELNPGQTFYKNWSEKASAKHSSPVEYAADALRKAYPKHSLVTSLDAASFGLPGVIATPLEDVPLITGTRFLSLSRMDSPVPGALLDLVIRGAFDLSWEGYEFIVYIISYFEGYDRTATFLLHQGPEDPIRSFLLASGIWRNELHDEIWVFNQGYWAKDAELYAEIQKASWDDVILSNDFKMRLQKDVHGFFSSRELYKKLSIPWKRGLIMHGPPGNGKTISLKAIMKSCAEKGYSPLYVKSFQSWMGEEASMAVVFNKARLLAPCVLILEDLDSLINNSNRSFFLNQLDGLSGNDGLLLIATTNHFDSLDPGLRTRPSRFDRNFLFDDPGLEERTLYAKYWQNKLEGNQEIYFPDSLVDLVAAKTASFSFAYLKEGFVSSLVILAGVEEESKPKFEDVLLHQIELLRKQIGKSAGVFLRPANTPEPPRNPLDFRALLAAVPRHLMKEPVQGKTIMTLERPFANAMSKAVGTGGPPLEQSAQILPGGWHSTVDDVQAFQHLPVFKK